MLRLTKAHSPISLGSIPGRAAHRGTLPAKESNVTLLGNRYYSLRHVEQKYVTDQSSLQLSVRTPI